MIAQGQVHKYGDDIDTDVIIPARYLNTSDPEELKTHCMEDIDKDFAKKVKKGDIIVAGKNFGCGSSREHAPIAILASGISCVIAESFSRIFYRNAINIGLPIIESVPASRAIKNAEIITVDFDKGIIQTDSESFDIPPYPEFIKNIIKEGGLMNAIKHSGN